GGAAPGRGPRHVRMRRHVRRGADARARPRPAGGRRRGARGELGGAGPDPPRRPLTARPTARACEDRALMRGALAIAVSLAVALAGCGGSAGKPHRLKVPKPALKTVPLPRSRFGAPSAADVAVIRSWA